MQKKAHRFRTSETITIASLEEGCAQWLDDSDIRQHSPNTVDARRNLTEKLLWFLHQREVSECGTPEIRSFLAYLVR